MSVGVIIAVVAVSWVALTFLLAMVIGRGFAASERWSRDEPAVTHSETPRTATARAPGQPASR